MQDRRVALLFWFSGIAVAGGIALDCGSSIFNPFIIWTAAPAVYGLLMIGRHDGILRHPMGPWIDRALGLLYLVSSAVIYGQSMYGNPSSTAGLIFIFIPMYQLFAVAGCDVLVSWIVRVLHPPDPPPNVPVCLACGYNLTGNVTSRCPECGAEIPMAVPFDDDPSP